MSFEVDASLNHGDAFRLKKFTLQGSDGFADEEFATIADYAVPGNASSGWGRRHSSSYGPRPAPQVQSLGERPIGSNPSAGNLLHESIDRIPSHSEAKW
jgi:hypothetical protein